MLLSLPLLPVSTVDIARDPAGWRGWAMAAVSFLLYGVGTLISGAPFLALVHDSAPYARRGQATAIVQFMLVVSFAFIPAIYAQLMPAYSPELFWRLVLIGMSGATVFWVVSVIGEERPKAGGESARTAPPFRATFSEIWADQRTRRYAVFLGVSAFFAFMQDAMLEPFGGDVFGLAVGQTTLFNAYWGTGVLVGLIVTYVITGRTKP
jgi:BCD family chlorophyll transporter-like MFS transporter